jgi:hypothetical protein
MHLFDVKFFVVHIALSAVCFLSFRTIRRKKYDRIVPLRMTLNELKHAEYSTTRRKECVTSNKCI